MNRLFLLTLFGVFACCMVLRADEEKSFSPFSEDEKGLYKFQLQKNFFADEAAWKAKMEAARQVTAQLEKLKGKVLSSAADLLATMDLQRNLWDLQEFLFAPPAKLIRLPISQFLYDA